MDDNEDAWQILTARELIEEGKEEDRRIEAGGWRFGDWQYHPRERNSGH